MNSLATVRQGRLEGANKEGIHSCLGVPYAKPPVGSLRWCAPEPLEKWGGCDPRSTLVPSRYRRRAPVSPCVRHGNRLPIGTEIVIASVNDKLRRIHATNCAGFERKCSAAQPTAPRQTDHASRGHPSSPHETTRQGRWTVHSIFRRRHPRGDMSCSLGR